jgi:hypothetical protein
MVSVCASSAVNRGFEPRLGQTKDYKIGMCCVHVVQNGEKTVKCITVFFHFELYGKTFFFP